MKTLEEILDVAKIHKKRAKYVCLFGSRIYGTNDTESDWDVVVVANSSIEAREVKNADLNIHIYTPERWKKDLEWHTPKCLECHFSPDWAKLMDENEISLEINNARLRHAFAHVSSNSWVKCKKKLTDGEYRTAIKSIFHSIRIPMMGSDIATNGKITDFSLANHIWNELISKEWDWNSLDKRFREERANVMTQFRKLAPKD